MYNQSNTAAVLQFPYNAMSTEAGTVKRVIIKDMSRFGRDYLQVGMYMEIMFPEHDVLCRLRLHHVSVQGNRLP